MSETEARQIVLIAAQEWANKLLTDGVAWTNEYGDLQTAIAELKS